LTFLDEKIYQRSNSTKNLPSPISLLPFILHLPLDAIFAPLPILLTYPSSSFVPPFSLVPLVREPSFAPPNEPPQMPRLYQLFNLIFKREAFFRRMAKVPMIPTMLRTIIVGRCWDPPWSG